MNETTTAGLTILLVVIIILLIVIIAALVLLLAAAEWAARGRREVLKRREDEKKILRDEMRWERSQRWARQREILRLERAMQLMQDAKLRLQLNKDTGKWSWYSVNDPHVDHGPHDTFRAAVLDAVAPYIEPDEDSFVQTMLRDTPQHHPRCPVARAVGDVCLCQEIAAQRPPLTPEDRQDVRDLLEGASNHTIGSPDWFKTIRMALAIAKGEQPENRSLN